MKALGRVTLLTVALSLLLLTSSARATQIKEFAGYVTLERDGNAKVELLITFGEATNSFEMIVNGMVENFTSDAPGEHECRVSPGEVSLINCSLSLGPSQTLKLKFATEDFVKPIEDRYYFFASFDLDERIERLYVLVKLPEGMSLMKEHGIFPPGENLVSDGRRIIIFWMKEKYMEAGPLTFKFSFEQPIKMEEKTTFPMLWIAVSLGVIAASAVAFVMRYLSRTKKKLVLSVLDEYERKVLEVILFHGGRVHQRKIVKESGISKAKVSRVLRSLSERGIVSLERRGRTNLVKLKQRFLRW